MGDSKITRISLPLNLEVLATEKDLRLSEEKLHKEYIAAFRSIASAVQSSSSKVKPNIRIDKASSQVFADIEINTEVDLFDEDDVSDAVKQGLADMISLSDQIHSNIKKAEKENVKTLQDKVDPKRFEAGVKLFRARQNQGNDSLKLSLGSKDINIEPLEPMNEVFLKQETEELELVLENFSRSNFVIEGKGVDEKRYKFKIPLEEFASVYAAWSSEEAVKIKASLRRPLLPRHGNKPIEGSLVEVISFNPEESLWREILGKMLGFSFFKKLVKE